MNNNFWNKNFSLYFAATTFSSLAGTLTSVALAYLILEKTGSGSQFALSLGLTSALALLSPLAGSLVDKWSLKPLLVTADVIRGILLLGLILISTTDHFSIYYVYGMNLINGLLGLVYAPAIGKLLPRLVPKGDLMRANGLLGSVYDTSQILGFVLGGVAVAFFGSVTALGFQVASFLLMGLVFLFINTGDNIQKKASSTNKSNQSLKNGTWSVFLYMLRSGIIICPILIFMVYLYTTPFRVLLPIQHNSTVFGAFFAFYSGGTLLSGLLAASLNERLYRKDLMIGGILLAPLFVIAAAFYTHPFFLYALSFLIGLVTTLSSTISYTAIQSLIKDDIRGRVFGIMGMIERGGLPLAYLALSASVDKISPTFIYLAFGILLLVSSIAMALHLRDKTLFLSEGAPQ